MIVSALPVVVTTFSCEKVSIVCWLGFLMIGIHSFNSDENSHISHLGPITKWLHVASYILVGGCINFTLLNLWNNMFNYVTLL